MPLICYDGRGLLQILMIIELYKNKSVFYSNIKILKPHLLRQQFFRNNTV